MGNKAKWGEPGQTISVYVTKQQAETLERAARTEQTTVSELVRRCIRKAFFLPDEASISKRSA